MILPFILNRHLMMIDYKMRLTLTPIVAKTYLLMSNENDQHFVNVCVGPIRKLTTGVIEKVYLPIRPNPHSFVTQTLGLMNP